MVTQQLDHLVLNLTKPGIRGLVRDAAMVRPVPEKKPPEASSAAGPPRRRDARAGRRPPGKWTAGSRRPRHAARSRPLRRGAGGTPRSLGSASPSSHPAVGTVLYGTDDAREGIAAFVAKRKPRFGGH